MRKGDYGYNTVIPEINSGQETCHPEIVSEQVRNNRFR